MDCLGYIVSVSQPSYGCPYAVRFYLSNEILNFQETWRHLMGPDLPPRWSSSPLEDDAKSLQEQNENPTKRQQNHTNQKDTWEVLYDLYYRYVSIKVHQHILNFIVTCIFMHCGTCSGVFQGFALRLPSTFHLYPLGKICSHEDGKHLALVAPLNQCHQCLVVERSCYLPRNRWELVGTKLSKQKILQWSSWWYP